MNSELFQALILSFLLNIFVRQTWLLLIKYVLLQNGRIYDCL